MSVCTTTRRATIGHTTSRRAEQGLTAAKSAVRQHERAALLATAPALQTPPPSSISLPNQSSAELRRVALTGRLFCFGRTRTDPYQPGSPAGRHRRAHARSHGLRARARRRARPRPAHRAGDGRPRRRQPDHRRGLRGDQPRARRRAGRGGPDPRRLVAGGQLRRHRPPADPRQGLEPLRRPPRPRRDRRRRSTAASASPASCWAPTTTPPGCGWTTAAKSRFRLTDIRRAKLVLTDALIAATATPPRTN